MEASTEKEKRIKEISRLSSLLDNAQQVYNAACEIGIKVTYKQVLEIMKDEIDTIQSFETDIINKIAKEIKYVTDIRVIKNSIEYNGVHISKKKFDRYFEKASEIYIEAEIKNITTHIFKLTSDKHMVQRLAEAFNISVKSDDLREGI